MSVDQAQPQVSYALATFSNSDLDAVRTLTQDEFTSYASEIASLEQFEQEEKLFRLVELNHADLKKTAAHYQELYTQDPQADFTRFSDWFLDLNRLVLNLLSSIRTYLDHSETRFKRQYGAASPEYTLFKKMTAEAFDNHFAYRFMAKLRNYAQHCGLPAGSINIQSSAAGETLTLLLVRDNLLQEFDSWGAIVKPELQAQPERFDILPLVQAKVNLLENINRQLYEQQLAKLTAAGNHLLELINETQDKSSGHPCLLKITRDPDDPDKASMEMKWFPYEVISRITGIRIVSGN